jgi:3-hydroxybutyryl-CoA dehydrogenase
MGPFELLDLTGLDVSHPVMESIYNQYYQEPRYRPNVLTQQMLTGKKLGRKTGQGFYRYLNQKNKRLQSHPAMSPIGMESKKCGCTQNSRTILNDYHSI